MIAEQLGHADRVEPFRGYRTGLLLPGERKSVEPMAARISPRHVRLEHQRLHHFVADAPRSDAAVRVRCATRDTQRSEMRPEEWLLIEWPKGEPEPTKYFLSTLPAGTPMKELVRIAKLRWRIERDYQELKQELGLGHFEGRSWRGFHHHATLCIAAYGFLLTERLAAPKQTLLHSLFGKVPALPKGFRPRGSPARPAPRPGFDPNATPGDRRRAHRKTGPLPMLRPEKQ